MKSVLTAKDLVPLIGSQSKVSEVLAGKRALSKAMIRNLSLHLGIPAEVLLQEPSTAVATDAVPAERLPFAAMLKAGYFPDAPATLGHARQQYDRLVAGLFAVWQGREPQLTYCRKGARDHDVGALKAWQARVATLAANQPVGSYEPKVLTPEFCAGLRALSDLDQGPLLAREKLAKHGVHLVILKHLPRTYLDGAAFFMPSGKPVIAMSLRHDRIDNFWFTLFHELGHVLRHLTPGKNTVYVDDVAGSRATKGPEHEADDWAANAFIPDAEWWAFRRTRVSAERIRDLARKLGISPALVAGRWQRETGNFKDFHQLLGHGKVRCLFPEWR